MRSLRRAIFALIACVLMGAGCGAHRCPVPPRLAIQGRPVIDVHVYVSDEFNERERSNIVNGILMWERATSGLVIWHLVPFTKDKPPPAPSGESDGVEHRSVMFRRAVSDDQWVKDWDAEHKKTLLGLCQGNSLKETAWLWLVENRLTTPLSETIIAAHEFGHALGIDHIEDKASVMSEFYNRETNCLTTHDLQAFCKKHGCSTEGLKPVCADK